MGNVDNGYRLNTFLWVQWSTCIDVFKRKAIFFRVPYWHVPHNLMYGEQTTNYVWWYGSRNSVMYVDGQSNSTLPYEYF